MTKNQVYWLLGLACGTVAQVIALTMPRGLVGLVLGAAASVIAMCVHDEREARRDERPR